MDTADQTKRKRALSDIGNLQDQKRSKADTAAKNLSYLTFHLIRVCLFVSDVEK